MELTALAQTISDQISNTANNQFLSGGLVLGLIGGTIAMLRRTPSRLWNWFLHLFTISIDVISSDRAYQPIMFWLSKQPYVNRSRRLSMKFINGDLALVPSHGNHFFMWRQTPIWIRWMNESGNGGSPGSLAELVPREIITVRILGRNQDIVRDLFREAEELGNIDMQGKLQLYLRQGSWEGGWRSETRKPRSMDTIFLPDGAKGLVDDARAFLGRREWYETRGIPYRRGYLFSGPPGSGKSSVAIGLASTLNVPLYILNLASVRDDNDLEKTVFSIDTATPLVLLIEDIDTALPDRELNKQQKHFSLGTLLNIMDGAVARENVILIVTTNNKEILDPALIRPGRIDQHLEFGHASTEQLSGMIRLFVPGHIGAAQEKLLPQAGTISMASAQEILLAMAQGSVQ